MGKRLLGVLILSLTLGCASEPVNPSFDVSREIAAGILTDIAAHPKALDRPLILVGGFNDPGLGSAIVAMKVRRYFTDERILCVNVFSGLTFVDCRRQLLNAVIEKFPGQEVDVIGLSMGGLVARYAATEIDGQKLPARRLFTISSPHAGAKMASVPTLDQKVLDMRQGSGFLTDLAGHDRNATYQLYCYTRLDDGMVGGSLAAPPGSVAWWVSNPPMESSHLGAMTDDRIIADIVLRLRNEAPLTRTPPAPLPTEK